MEHGEKLMYFCLISDVHHRMVLYSLGDMTIEEWPQFMPEHQEQENEGKPENE